MTTVDVVVLGGCIIDLISYAKRFPKPGETLAGKMFSKGFGGKGANQCVMAKRLGAITALIAKLGRDTFGQEYVQYIKESDIISDCVIQTETSNTSTASICVTDEGQNSIVFVPGAIMELTADNVKSAEHLIKNAKVLLCTYEAPLEALLQGLTIAKKYKVLTVVNAAPAASGYEELYPLADIICLNEVEAEEATGIPVTSTNSASQAVQVLLEKQCSRVILTLGENGSVFADTEQRTCTHIPARCVKPVDSTGAGDAFMGSLVYYLSKFPNLTFQEMIRRSCQIATMSVLKHGTQSSFPYREDLPKSLLEASDG